MSRTEYMKAYRQKHKKELSAKRNERLRRKYKEDDQTRLTYNYRKRVQRLITGKISFKGLFLFNSLIGCTPVYFRYWIAERLGEGFCFCDYGKAWSIDHLVPCSKYDLTDWEQVKKCFHYTNLRPLSIEENTRKGNRNEV